MINYKKFKIGDLFEKVKCNTLPYKAGDLKQIQKSEETIPVLTAGIENQGLAYYAPRKNATILKNVISVSANGANTGAMFYQPYEFTVLQDSYAIRYKFKELTENQYLFFVCLLQKVVRKNYDWSNKAGWEKIKKLDIAVPVKTNNNIDYDYMENYIEQLTNERMKEVDNQLSRYGLNDFNLTEDEKKLINSKINTREYRIGELFFVKGNPQLNKDSFEFNVNGEYPYFTRTVFNNGIAGYVNYLDEEHKIKGNSIAVGMLGMQFFYMEKDFYAGQFTKTIYPKFDKFNENIALYFIALFNKKSDNFKAVLVRDFEKTFLNDIIELPIRNDEIDFEYIEDFIKIQKKFVMAETIKYKNDIQ